MHNVVSSASILMLLRRTVLRPGSSPRHLPLLRIRDSKNILAPLFFVEVTQSSALADRRGRSEDQTAEHRIY